MIYLTDSEPRFNLLDREFDFLKVIEWVGRNGKGKNGKHYWKCVCKCGRTIIASTNKLTSGNTKSCGCYRASIPRMKWWKGYGELSGRLWNQTIRQGKKRGFEISISIEDVWELFLKQDRKCALTNMPIAFPPTARDKGTASLDRIDSKKGYVVGNVQWVHKDINKMKMEFNQEYFIMLCELIVNQSKS